jgi:hypothetical protein
MLFVVLFHVVSVYDVITLVISALFPTDNIKANYVCKVVKKTFNKYVYSKLIAAYSKTW